VWVQGCLKKQKQKKNKQMGTDFRSFTSFSYDITRANFNNEDFEKLDSRSLPDVVLSCFVFFASPSSFLQAFFRSLSKILVKKSYTEKRKKNKVRPWQLKRLEEGTQTFGYERKRDIVKAE